MENFSTTCYQQLQPEVLFVLVNVSEQFEELLCAWWACATFKPAVKLLALHLLLGELLALEGYVPIRFVFHGDSP